MMAEMIPYEDAEQIELARWLDARKVLWFHCPNGSLAAPQYRAKLARLGVKKGVPDIIILDVPPGLPWIGVAIEMKRQKGGSVSKEQKAWLMAMLERGWFAFVAKGASAAIKELEGMGY